MKTSNALIWIIVSFLSISCARPAFYHFNQTQLPINEMSNTPLMACLPQGSVNRIADSIGAIANNNGMMVYHRYFESQEAVSKPSIKKRGNVQTTIYALKKLREVKRSHVIKPTLKKHANSSDVLKTGIPQEEKPKKTSAKALMGFIFSVASLFSILIPPLHVLFFPFCVLGVIFSAIGLNKIRKNPDTLKGRRFAVVGLTIGIVEAAIIVIGLVVAVILGLSAFGQ